MGDLGFQASEGQSQWQFTRTGGTTGPRQSTFGSQVVQNTDVIMSIVAGASEAALEHNTFYMGLKTMANNQATELEALRGTIEQKIQEIVGCNKVIDILKVQCETLEYLPGRNLGDAVTADTTGPEGRLTDLQGTTILSRALATTKRNEHPKVMIWIKHEFALTVAKAKAQKGESSGDPSDAAKTKGKVGHPSKRDQEEVGHKYIYLQHCDGTPISIKTLGNMSIKARSLWDFLLKKGMATPTFCKLPWDALDLYTCAMLTDPEFDFLLLCNNTTWKLQEWSIQNYLCQNADALDDPVLIRIKSSDGTDNSNDSTRLADNGTDNNIHGIRETTPGPGPEDTGIPQPDDDPRDDPTPSTQSSRGPFSPKENLAPSTQLSRGPAHAPIVSTSSLVALTGVARINPTPTAPASTAPIQTSKDTTTTTQANTTVVQGNQDAITPPVPSKPTQTLVTGPSNSQPPIPSQPIPNLRLERAMANAEKNAKEAKDRKWSSRTYQHNHHQWNERQPGGQGLAADFDAYFKGLSDTDKEPFKKEMRTAQAAVRKAKTAAKKPREVPSVD
ncbi:hypothetical protein H4582DRAFT_2064418 [Lactarius indigo]|nr:hypothetical protein H4582DRAFT_2064418 [Lactarius indigo]